MNSPALAREVLQDPAGHYRPVSTALLAALELVTPPASRWVRTGDRAGSVARAQPGDDRSGGGVDRLASVVAGVVDRMTVTRWQPGTAVELANETGVLAATLVRSALLGMDPDEVAGAVLSDAFRFALSLGSEPSPAGAAERQRWRAAVHDLRATAMAAGPAADEDTTARRTAGFPPVMLATYSPMATALLWAAVVLTTRPAVRGAVADELGDRPLAAALGAPYLSGVVRELLRLYPPAYALTRMARADCTVGGFAVPDGTKVIVSPYLLHRRPDCWDDPLSFRPERFAGGTKGVHVPFGAGDRGCPGQAVAVILLQLTVAALARGPAFVPEWDGPVRPASGWALRPSRPLPARVAAGKVGRHWPPKIEPDQPPRT